MGNTTVFHVETPWTRIIPDDLWNAVRKRPINTANMNRMSRRYLLSGKIACEQCDRSMGIGKRSGRFKAFCKHEDTRFDCRDLPLNPLMIEALAVSGLLESVGSQDDEDAFSGSLRRAVDERNADYDRQRTNLLATIAEIDTELDCMLNDLSQLSSEAARTRFNKRFDDRNAELESCRARYQEIQHLHFDMKELDNLSVGLASDWIRANEFIQPREGYEETYEMMDAVIHMVRVKERPGLRHDVTVTYRWSLPGHDEPIEITRTFEDQLIADDKVRKREEIKHLTNGIRDGKFDICRAEMDAIERTCAEFMFKFKNYASLAAGTFLASLRNPGIQLVTVAHCFGCDKEHQLDALRAYSRHDEWKGFVELLLGEDTDVPDKATTVKIRRSATPTMRDKLVMVDSPILRLALVNPAMGDRVLSDDEWTMLMASVGNERGTAFRGWAKTSDRKALNTYLHIIRNNLRRSEIPAGMLTHSRVNRLLRHLDDEGAVMDVLEVLLRMQGEKDMPDPNALHKLSSPVESWSNGPRKSHKIIPGIVRKGRKPLLAKRQAARAEHSPNGSKPA